jgi:hypothetical protein
MSLISVVQDVCAVVGVSRPSSIFSGLNSSRTQQEMLALANEMAQRIAYNTREWGVLKKFVTFDRSTGTDQTIVRTIQTNFTLPADYKRLLLASNVWRVSAPAVPLRFIADPDQWLQRRLWNYQDPKGEWHLATYLSVAPPPSDLRVLLPAWANNTSYAVSVKIQDTVDGTFWVCNVLHTSAPAGTFAADRAARPTYWTQTFQETLVFLYLSKNCIILASGGFGDTFTADGDGFILDERLLKLGMIWQWKANKGSPYAEDMGTYSDALAVASGADAPAPIIIGRLPISAAANVAFPWPSTWGPQP